MKKTDSKERKRGQIMLEYAVALGVFMAMLGLCAALLYGFKSYGGRVLSLMASA